MELRDRKCVDVDFRRRRLFLAWHHALAGADRLPDAAKFSANDALGSLAKSTLKIPAYGSGGNVASGPKADMALAVRNGME